MDDDILPLKPLSQIARASENGLFLVDDRPHTDFWGRSVYNGTLNGAMGAVSAGNPIFKCALDSIAQTVLSRSIPTKGNQFLAITGPQSYNECVTGLPKIYRFVDNMVVRGNCYDGTTHHGCDVVMIHKPFKTNTNRSRGYLTFNIKNSSDIYTTKECVMRLCK